MKQLCSALITCCLLCLAPAARAATPRDAVLRLVPDDVGFCLLVQDLREHARAFGASPFLAQLCASPLGAKLLGSPEAKTLTQVKGDIEQHLEMPLARLRDDIFGDAVVLAYRPGPADDPAREQGLLALHARDAELLARLVGRVNVLQHRAGDLKEVESKSHRGVAYQRRVLTVGVNYLCVRGPLFVFATRESLLRELIDRHLADAPAGEATAARQFRRLGLEGRLASLWVNPRPFDAALRRRAEAEEASGVRASALKTLLTYWQALDGVALSLGVREELELVLTARVAPERLPPAARKFLDAAGKTSDLWACFPPDAVLTAAGRLDVLAFADMLGDFLPGPARGALRAAVEQRLGVLFSKDVLATVLPRVGPDWGFCVLTPRAEDKGCVPPLVFAVRVRPGAEEALVGAVAGWADLLAKAFNQLHGGTMSLLQVIQANVEVNYLTEERVLPPGFRPAFALKGGYLLLASSPEAIRRFATGPAPIRPAETAEVPLVRFAPQALAAFLQERRASLTGYLALVHQLPPAEVAGRLGNLVAALELLDRVEVVQRSSADQVTLVLRVRTARPLR